MYCSENVLLSVVDPWKVNICGPDTVAPDTQSEFTCCVNCTVNVDCTISWHVTNGFSNESISKNKFKLTASRNYTSLNITCVVTDLLTAQYSVEETKTVEVTGNLVLFFFY